MDECLMLHVDCPLTVFGSPPRPARLRPEHGLQQQCPEQERFLLMGFVAGGRCEERNKENIYRTKTETR
jgi:hypothetical protein